ncbi:error-prone DNA polymerase [Pseudomonas guariconensis]|uniref:error-prone DNA polymerase n=1 Tax=Pseudomonas guariconensis TaxID=1288410 RepID=UPI0018AB2BC7|nr:error-prone DNA polymerase [Pseudomonas guariconensis]MBF8723168.1 error-prone DNA polymerase [Pseudomonas guariconensis]MBF8794184.1 error-prone DNA polymerase [Pseudomonas monteilii]
MSAPGYAELHCLSNFSFQRGASSADELFRRAKALGYEALAITDECTLAGIVRAWQAARQHGVRLIIGSEVQLEQGPRLVLLVEDLTGYQNLCGLITQARRRAQKGQYQVLAEDLQGRCQGLLALWVADADDDPATGQWLQSLFGPRLWLAVHLHRGCDDARRLQRLRSLAGRLGIRAVACGDVHMHVRGRRALQDCMTAIRQHCTVAQAGRYLFANGERHLRTWAELTELYPADLLAEAQAIAGRCHFDLGELKYQYPRELVPQGHTPGSWLRHLCQLRLPERWPQGPSAEALATLERELCLIQELGYESYFLTVHDIVDFARKQGILCQGRGSAANSVVCFVLGITELDPMEHRLLFERFLSRERNEPPDIDVDFEHERREEVIQYVFRRYGRHRAALTAVVNTYHAAGAVRDVARALGLPADQVDALAKCCGRWSDRIPDAQRLAEAGFEAQSPSLRRILVLAGELIGFPRHLSQHPGGFVISEQPLDHLVPVENAAMAERTVIQWDKDDLDLVGLLKVDVLALGMLSALRRCFDLLARHRGRHLTLASIPKEDEATYAMISRAETMGVFQIESRAQMAMLPRLKPQKFYDLVIEVAIVRPGPIQGDMVHPYLRRRLEKEPVTYPSPKLKDVFGRTLGVPLFQEQVMELAMVAADYTPGEADQLRRSMAAWKRHGGLEPHRERLLEGMKRNGYEQAFAERIFEQIKGFGSYGFPESHAASFALLCYASSWLKCHEPAIFACALVNSWPMGFYSPDQLLQEARRQGIEVRPVDVCHSEWDCTLEPDAQGALAIRLGLRQIRGFSEADARRLEQARALRPWRDVEDLCLRAELDSRARARLADAGALRALASDRHQARWQVAAVQAQLPLFAQVQAMPEVPVALPMPTVGEDLFADYATLGTTLGPHPLALLRRRLRALGCRSSVELAEVEHGDSVAVAGLVVGRQRPQTASGVTFVTLEDEHGMVNVVVWRDLAERQRRALVGSQLLKVSGRLEQEKGVRHLVARRLEDISLLLQGLDVRSRDFH